ncbi:MAG: glucose-phosphate thymidylyltransferase [Parcubacteria group bacterium]|nr:glucose-phosphate thymidylyltransferase [Parcubacteria group bacterium]
MIAAMQAVILAAGRGTRMNSLTDAVPKPMLRVAGKTLLEHKFDALPPDVHEIILIVGYLAAVIEGAFGSEYKGIPVRYIHQEKLDGTMGALMLAKSYLNERFLVMMGDDLYGADDIERTIAEGDWAMLVEETKNMAAGGRIVTDESGEVVAIEEGDHRGKEGLMNTNMFVLDPRVFEYRMIPKAAGSDEYGLPQTVLAASKESDIALHAVPARHWLQVTSPEDIEETEKRLKAFEDTATA